jgi:hypothetical protein
LTFLWQIRDNKLWVQSPPATGQTLTFFYMSQGWVQDGANPNLIKNIASQTSDIIMFDQYLMTLLARWKWLELKGFDSTAAKADFTLNYQIRKGKAKGAPVLSMTKVQFGMPYLNMSFNAPDTGYGGAGY